MKSEPSLTKEEVDRLTSDDQFHKLMGDYVKEISDPKHRAEQEAYLNQLEEQNDLPEGRQIIRPSAAFVLKFKYVEKSELATKLKNKKRQSNLKKKLFINAVYSDLIEKPTSRKSKKAESSVSGTYWSLPYSMGPLRMEYGTGKNQVPTLDCCFHPEVLVRGFQSAAFRDLIANVAREGAIQKMKNDPIDINPCYHILRGIRYKSGVSPCVLVISSNGLDADKVPTTPVRNDSKGTSSPETAILRDDVNRFSKNTALKKGFLVSQKDAVAPSDTARSFASGARKGGGETRDGKVTPYFEVIEKGEFELLDHTINIRGLKRSSTRPKFLEYRISLPRVQNANNIDLDVSEERMVLTSLPESNSDYYLSVQLPYQVLVDGGTAKFDISSSRLIVTLSVSRPEPQALQSSLQNIPSGTNSTRTGGDDTKTELKSTDKPTTSSMTTKGMVYRKEDDSETKQEHVSLEESRTIVEMAKRQNTNSKNHSRWLDPSSGSTDSASEQTR